MIKLLKHPININTILSRMTFLPLNEQFSVICVQQQCRQIQKQRHTKCHKLPSNCESHLL